MGRSAASFDLCVINESAIPYDPRIPTSFHFETTSKEVGFSGERIFKSKEKH